MEARFETPDREYGNDEIVVEWRHELCFHARECTRGLPAVFDGQQRPWIDVSAATPEAIEQIVARCPSGALRAHRVGVRIVPDGEATVTVTENGPYVLTGNLRIVRSTGEELGRLEKVALCRCGQSGNKPFCDGTHEKVGFREG
jgi:uncharacterized Fe-S cluster protein YjdI